MVLFMGSRGTNVRGAGDLLSCQREVKGKMTRRVRQLVFCVLLLVLLLVMVLPSSLTGAAVKTGDIREFRFNPAVLIEEYQGGERLVRTTIVGSNVEATVGADKLSSEAAVGRVDGELQVADNKATILRTPDGKVVLQWDYDSYKRSISVEEGSLKEEYALRDMGDSIINLVHDGELFSEDFEVSHISDPDSTHLVWMKDLILWTESEGYKWVSFYFDTRVVPAGLTDEELVDYWEELRYLAREQFVTIVDGQQDYSAMAEYYLGFVESQLDNYMIMGVYNTDPGALRQVIRRQEVQVGGSE